MQTQKNGHTILIGEDELEVRAYLEMALKCLGYTVESAQDGEEVVQQPAARNQQLPLLQGVPRALVVVARAAQRTHGLLHHAFKWVKTGENAKCRIVVPCP